MIDLAIFDVLALPSCILDRPSRLPKVAAIYFVLDGSNLVRYVGQTGNLRKRYVSCGFPRDFTAVPQGHIAWLLMEDPVLRRIIEGKFIRHFNPQLNRTYKPRAVPRRSITVEVSQALYDTIEAVAFEGQRTVSKEILLLIEETFVLPVGASPSSRVPAMALSP